MPPGKRKWEEIREERDDLTDYVVHLTRPGLGTLLAILRSGAIKPEFGVKPVASRTQCRG
jgi:hypothetical protein